jgi:uncharacterized protein
LRILERRVSATLPSLAPLSEPEVAELRTHLSQSEGASLDYARGVFTAVAMGPIAIEPTEWLAWVLGPGLPDKSTLRQVIALLVRDAQSIAECLDLGEPWLPDGEAALVQFCKGFTRVTQHGSEWQKSSGAFVQVLPIAVQAGYLDVSSVERFVPAGESAQDWLDAEQRRLAERLLTLHAHFAPARAARRQRPLTSEKVGRNEPCPCGSGKKHKKCCAQ